jgi:2'-5' RNA ligase
MNSCRLFLAVDLPFPVKKACFRFAQELKASGADVKWTEEENLHVTLKFLGEVAEDTIGKLTDICRETAGRHRAFSFTLEEIGAFPSVSAPRVLWAGVGTAQDRFTALAQDLGAALKPLGFKKEDRAFHPHVTLGRVRSPLRRVFLIEALQKHKDSLRLTGIPARAATLFASTLTPAGAAYTPRAILPLCS